MAGTVSCVTIEAPTGSLIWLVNWASGLKSCLRLTANLIRMNNLFQTRHLKWIFDELD